MYDLIPDWGPKTWGALSLAGTFIIILLNVYLIYLKKRWDSPRIELVINLWKSVYNKVVEEGTHSVIDFELRARNTQCLIGEVEIVAHRIGSGKNTYSLSSRSLPSLDTEGYAVRVHKKPGSGSFSFPRSVTPDAPMTGQIALDQPEPIIDSIEVRFKTRDGREVTKEVSIPLDEWPVEKLNDVRGAPKDWWRFWG